MLCLVLFENALFDDSDLIERLSLSSKLDVHGGCVNTISWSEENPNLILGGSDDQKLSITDAFTGNNKCKIETSHRTNIFSAKFLPKTNSETIISCASGGDIQISNINETNTFNHQNRFLCHGEKAVYEIRVCPQNPFIFYSCGQDGTCKFYDIRQSSKCDKSFCKEHTLIKHTTGVTAITINPLIPYHVVCATLDGIVRFYDVRTLSVGAFDSNELLMKSSITNQLSNGLFACFGLSTNQTDSTSRKSIFNALSLSSTPANKRITSVQYNNVGSELLVSYQSDNIYLLDWRDLSHENRLDDNELNKNGETSPNISERKFRIQSDWSDTGPNSTSINEIDASDPRSFLVRRLNDWFANICQNRPTSLNNRSTLNTRNEDQFEDSRSASLSTTNDDEKSSPSDEKPGSSCSFQNVKEKSESETEEEQKSAELRRQNLLSATSSVIGSRIRTKQALKLEANFVKNKPSPKVKMIFKGHRNSRTIIKECNFWGNEYVISGSDCGHIFFWNKSTGKIVNVIEADKHVVNCVQENSFYPVLASSGIDYNIKIHMPTLEHRIDNADKIEKLTTRNKLMIDESRNTIFVPLQFMMPALRLFGNDINSRNLRRTTDDSNSNNEESNNQ